MLSQIKSACTSGINGRIINVEADISNGIPRLELVGFSGKVANESGERVRSAIGNSGYIFPVKKIILNLYPAEIKKEGSQFDLAAALAILKASGQICPGNERETEEYVFIGEASLNGRVNKVKGVLPIALEAFKKGYKGIVLPYENAKEAAAVRGIRIIGIGNIGHAAYFLENTECRELDYDGGRHMWENMKAENTARKEEKRNFSDIRGQREVKRALEIAAAGNHNCIMVGSPGSGKSAMAKCMPGILPEMTDEEAIETRMVYSVLGQFEQVNTDFYERPFRAPHHSISPANLIGGGKYPLPGEISMAHNGVLFMDEFCEFSERTLEMLREPIEEKRIRILRKGETFEFPADFILIVSTNPCKCGMLLERNGKCRCTSYEVQKYRNKISGAIMDRIDIRTEVRSKGLEVITKNIKEESSEDIKKRVETAREIQKKRYLKEDISANSQLDIKLIKKYISLDQGCKRLLERYGETHSMSTRGYISVLKVARTIADIECSEIKDFHIAEALKYRVIENFEE